MQGFLRECRYGLRTLRKSPGFAAVAILTLALGIGAATAIFSVVDAVLLRPLPYPNPQELVRIWERAPDGHRMNLADPNFDDFRSRNATLSEMAIYGSGTTAVSGGREPVRVDVAVVSRGFFPTLGVAPSLGRGFSPDEQRLHGTPAAIVSHDYWQRYLDGAADLSGRRIAMEGSVYQVVGVMPAGFDFPQGVAAWIPRELETELPSRTAHNGRAIGRLRPGVGLAAARANLNAIAASVKQQYDRDVDLVGAVVIPLQDALVGDVRTGLLTLSGAVGLLLLVAAANVAGLLLARTSSRRKELAVRAALGANRGRLMQQFLGESVALTGAGGALGILLAAAAVRVLPSILPANLPRQQGIAVDLPVLVFALAATAAVALSLALFAAWRAGGGDLQGALASGSRGDSGGGSSQRLRAVLVSGEIALTLVILVGAGLLGRSFLALVATSPGFRSDRLVTVEFASPRPSETGLTPAIPALGASPGTTRQVELVDRLAARLKALPGVEGVALAGAIPAAGGDNLADGSFLVLDGRASPKDFDEWGRMARERSATGGASYAVTGPDYFGTLGIPLVRGRFFGPGDEAGSTHVAVISETLAKQRWPGQDPIGHVINFGNMDGDLRPLTIVGVAGDVRAAGLDRPPAPIVYVSYRQRGIRPDATPTFLVRTTAAPSGPVASAARGIFRELAPDLPVRVSTFDAEMGGWLADRRFLLLLVGVFAASALLLAAVGIYGIVAFSVARRTREIGIRMALGAERRDVLRMLVGEGAGLALTGIAAGIVVSLAVTRLVASLLFGVRATDPVTFGAVSALLAGAALAASYLPARRAMRLDPNAALRVD